MSMASSLVPDARRIRSFFTKLPLATRLLLALITAFWVARVFRPGLEQWGALIPQEINIGTRKAHARELQLAQTFLLTFAAQSTA